MKAIFLDRDGTINNDTGRYYTYSPDEFELNKGVLDFLKACKAKSYRLILISNQSGISKGIYKKEDVEKTHKVFIETLKLNNIEFSEMYYCTHHPDFEKCFCRKPQSLLFEKAIARFNINPSESIMIGDAQRDIDAAEKVGIRGILVPKNGDLSKIITKI